MEQDGKRDLIDWLFLGTFIVIFVVIMLAVLGGCSGLKPSQKVQAIQLSEGLNDLGEILPLCIDDEVGSKDAVLETVERMGTMADDLADIKRDDSKKEDTDHE